MTAPLPSQGLYGDGQAGRFPDALHVEAIATRSSIHDWRIRPHRHHDLVQMFLVGSGGGTATIDGERVDLSPPVALLVPPLVVHGFEFHRGTEGHVASVPTATLDRAFAGRGGDGPLFRGPLVIRPERADAERLAQVMVAATAEFAGRDPWRDVALAALAGLLAVWFGRAARPPATRPAEDGRRALVRRFLDRVEAEYRRQPPLSDHAAALGVSAPHLTRVCRAELGRPALAVVHDRLLLEAKRQLDFTSMSVAEIAYALGFSDPAYFTRFFTRRVGIAPSAYRIRPGAAAAGPCGF